MDYDFSKSFLSQFKELLHSAPIMSLLVSNNENSDYVNLETDDKNCYMNFGGHYNEDSYHNTYAIYTKNCVDNYWAWKCELLYESVESYTCYSSAYLENCNNCNDCYFGYDLKSCKNCIGCVGLRHKEFYIFNKPYSKKEFDDVKEKLKSYKFLKEFQAKFEKFSLSVPRKYAQLENCEDCSGDYMKGSKSLL